MDCSRRDFMRGMAACMGAGMMGSAFGKGGEGFFKLPGSNVSYSAGGRAASGGNIVVFVQMFGGNDGLNMVYPLTGKQRANYEQFRPTLKLPNSVTDLQPWIDKKIGDAVLDIGANTDTASYALNPGMGALYDLYTKGKVAVVPGVHYPAPNHSHFESTNIYTSADPAGGNGSGWFGRYLNTAGYTSSDIPTVILGQGQSPLFTPTTPGIFTFQNLDVLNFPSNDDVKLSAEIYNAYCNFAAKRDVSQFPELVKIAQTASASVSHLADYYQPKSADGKSIPAKVQALLVDKNGNYRRSNPLVYTSPLNTDANPNIANMDLAVDLKHVAAVIRADVGARFFHVGIGGFDTHSQQERNLNHSTLLHEVSESIAAFYSDLSQSAALPAGLSGYSDSSLIDRVVIVTFSEFGRTIRQNEAAADKAGTDHASSAPQFILGGKVLGGKQFGAYPQLDDPGSEADDDLKLSTDFRDVFGTVLNKWLNVSVADLGPGLGKILPATLTKDGDGKDYAAFTPLGFLS